MRTILMTNKQFNTTQYNIHLFVYYPQREYIYTIGFEKYHQTLIAIITTEWA